MMQQISSIASVVMALVWIVYLQFFLNQHRRQKRPSLVIHHAQGQDPNSACLLVNMSHNPIHVQCVIAEVGFRDGSCEAMSVTDFRRVDEGDSADLRTHIRQGPVQPGGYLMLGAFRDIMLGQESEHSRAADKRDDADSLKEICSLEMQVAVVHGPSRYPIGARRRFVIEHDDEGQPRIRATNIYTEQLVKRKSRRTVQRWVEKHIEPLHKGRSQSEDTNQSN